MVVAMADSNSGEMRTSGGLSRQREGLALETGIILGNWGNLKKDGRERVVAAG